jgi:lipopolysaccharide/colanic/teichoic acid biosynthesis glycosyltransferase
VVTVAAFVLAFSLRTEFAFSDPDWLAMLVGIPIVAVVALIAYHVVGLFRGTWSQTADADLIVVIKGASLVAILLIAGMVLTNTLSEIPRSVPLIHWFITVVGLYGSRMFWARRQAAKDAAHKPVALLVGCSEPAMRFLSSLELLASNRFRIFGMLDDSRDQRRIGRTIRGTPVIGHVDHAEACMGHLSVHGVFPDRFVVMNSFRRKSPERFDALRALAERRKVKLDVINDDVWLDEEPDEEEQTETDAKPLLKVKRYMHWRRPVELMIAMAMVTILSPLFILLAGLCLLDVGRPVFFWQMRPGRYLKPFKLVKFRTMRDGLDAEGKPLSDEARTSTLGRIIRRSKLDELPQLLSILSGNMSFIGPRPLLPRDQPEDAELRAIVRPGVTGWAQVNGGHPLEIEEKLALDIWYIKNASFGLDMKILWLTFRTVLFGEQVNRKAIKVALLTRQRMRPAARRLQAVAGGRPATKDGGGDAKKAEQGWWPRPADSLDRAS